MPRWTDFLQRLRGETRAHDRDRVLAILALNRHLAQAAGRQQVLTVLVDEAVRLFGAERGFLVTAAGAPPGFVVEVARSLDREPVANAQRKVSRTILARALEHGESTFSDDAQADEFGGADSIADLQLRSVLSVPLRVGDRVLGCLYLDHRFRAGAFAEPDLPWLAAFADQGAIVLHLHELLAQNRAQADALAQHNRSLQATVAAQAEALAAPPPPTRATLAHAFPGLIGESPALLRALHVLDRVAPTALPVLLTGESGTGKEVAARGLHAAGPRRSSAFVAVDTAALAAGLLESELFGHSRGAFTGAERDRPGLLRQAAGGTLFLDEITEMDLELQAKLLRALESRRVRPVGGDREFDIDVRVIAATNRDPRQAIAEGRLREDLYFRLAVVTVHLPALRERPEDIVPLAEHLLAAVAREHGAPPPVVGAELAAALRARSWPGNVRQLRNEMQRLWVLAAGGPLSPALLSPAESAPPAGGAPETLDLARVEQWAIDRALAAANGNKAEAARLLGIGRRTLYSKLEARPASDR